MKIKLLTFVLVLSLIGLFGIFSTSYATNQAGVSPTLTEPKPVRLSGGSEDSDNDNYSDLCEYLHKSDPQNKASTPKENITINVPSDVKTIQGAINASIDGDTIAVSQGKYQGNINFNGRTITITSLDPQSSDVVANTIIEGTESGSVVTIDSTTAVLKGFTVTSPVRNKFLNGASKNLDCRGIYCKDASPTIENCTIIDNQTTESGGGIYNTASSSPQIINCILTGNKDSSGIHESAQVSGGTPQISYSLIGQGLVDSSSTTTEPLPPQTTLEIPPIIQNTNKVGRTEWIKEGNIVHTSLILNQTSANNMTAMKEANISCSLAVSFQPPVFELKDSYSKVQISGLDTWNGTAGAPILPFKPMRILIPYGQKVVGVKVIPGSSQEISGEYILEPAQEPVPLSQLKQAQFTPPDPAIYNSDNPYPYVPCGDVFLQGKSGYAILILNLFPAEYHPLSRKIFYYPNMSVEVETVPLLVKVSTEEAGVSIAPDPQVQDEISSMVDNPEVIQTYETGAGFATLSETEYEYVIITSAALEGATGDSTFQDLIDSKIARGITATIVTTDYIYANYDGTRPDGGTDNQTKIRNFIIDYYTNHGTRYVLLGGDKDIVPHRLFFVSGGGESTDMPVDMYYGCLDGTFDEGDYNDIDGDSNYNEPNGIYGEPNDGPGRGEVDLYAEVFIGRAPVSTGDEVSNFVRKTLTYENATGDYLNSVYMVGEKLGFGGVSEYATDSMEEIRLGSDAHGYTTRGFENSLYVYADFFETHTLYEDKINCPPNWYYPPGWPKSELISIMNSGVHILNHMGHADYNYDMKLYTSNLTSLTNTDYFFAYSQGCKNGGFDTDECFAEVITTMDKGAFAVVMNARYGWGAYNSTDSPSQRYDREFWDAFLGENITNLGRMNQDSKEDNINKINEDCMRWCYYELNLFGDPEISINTINDPPTWYVDDDAPPGGDGTSWNTAFKYLQDALNNPVLIAGDAIGVAQGVYKPDQDKNNPNGTGNRNATFRLINGVTIQGGYAGLDYVELGAPSPYTRDIAHYETILSGDLSGNDGIPPNFANYGDNSYHVVSANGVDTATIIDGFIIEGGCSNASLSSHALEYSCWIYNGAGMRNSSSSPIVNNCTFRNNNAVHGGGGAIGNVCSSPQITNCTFIGNKGGTGWARAWGSLYLSGGGAIHSYYSSPQIKNCTFIDNYAEPNGGAIYAIDSQSEITNCIFSDNRSRYDGGAINNQSFPDTPIDDEFPEHGSSMTITNCVFAGNYCGQYGGALSNEHSPVVVTNSTFTRNYAVDQGGGVFNLGNSSSATLTNCIIWGNWVGRSGNYYKEVVSSYGTIDISYCNIKGDSPYPGVGNINSDPFFVNPDNPAGPDDIFRTEDDGLQLAPQLGLLSPCIDVAADDTAPITDILGNQRVDIPGIGPLDVLADMGAYEFNWWTTLGGFNWPTGIYYDNTPGEEYIYVAEDTDHDGRIVKTKIYGTGWTTLGGFSEINGIYYDNTLGEEYIYVASSSYIVKTKIEGPFQATLGGFSGINGIYYDNTPGEEYIYVADSANRRIVKTNIEGTDQTPLGGFSYPISIYYDSASEYIYVTDMNGCCIVKTNIEGTDQTTLGGFSSPRGIHYDSASKYIYVIDRNNYRIVKTNIEGTEWWNWYYGTSGSGVGQFKYPQGIYYDSATGYIYVADSGNNRIVRVFPEWQ